MRGLTCGTGREEFISVVVFQNWLLFTCSKTVIEHERSTFTLIKPEQGFSVSGHGDKSFGRSVTADRKRAGSGDEFGEHVE